MSRSTAAAGLLFVALALGSSLAFPHSPSSADPPAAIAASLARHRGSDLAGDYASLLGQPLLLIFLVGLASRLPRRGANLMLLAGAIAAGFELAATAVEIATTAGHMPAATVGALYQVASRLFYVNVLMLGVTASAGGAAALAASRRTGGVGLAAGVLLCAGGLAIAAPHGALGPLYLPGFLALFAWVALSAAPAARGAASRTSAAR